MTTRTFQIRNINWGEIPREDWELVLATIPIGGCVDKLPFKIPDHLRYIKVLKLKREPVFSVDLKSVDIEIDTMVFQEIGLMRGDFVWERTK